MKRAMKTKKIELQCSVGPTWGGNVNELANGFVVPDGYKLNEVKRVGDKFTFIYLKNIPRNPT